MVVSQKLRVRLSKRQWKRPSNCWSGQIVRQAASPDRPDKASRQLPVGRHCVARTRFIGIGKGRLLLRSRERTVTPRRVDKEWKKWLRQTLFPTLFSHTSQTLLGLAQLGNPQAAPRVVCRRPVASQMSCGPQPGRKSWRIPRSDIVLCSIPARDSCTCSSLG